MTARILEFRTRVRPNVGAVYDRPRFWGMQSDILRAVIARAYNTQSEFP